MKLTGTNTSVNLQLYNKIKKSFKLREKKIKIKMSTVPKSNSRANIGNIPWEIVCDKFMIFRKNNELSEMKDIKFFNLFIKKSPNPFSISSFRFFFSFFNFKNFNLFFSFKSANCGVKVEHNQRSRRRISLDSYHYFFKL